jgi:hypothetical protein
MLVGPWIFFRFEYWRKTIAWRNKILGLFLIERRFYFQMLKCECVPFLRNTVKNETQLKGHDNEADFLGILQKFVPHRSLTLPFEPFWFFLAWIRGDIRDRKTTPRLGELANRRIGESALSDSASRRVGFWMFKRKLDESESRRLGESLTPRLGKSGSRNGESGSRDSNFLKFFITLKSWTSPLKFGKKEARDVMYYHHWFI